ncbi:MAG: hypothetical protein IPP08_11110 [Chlorobiota bacterium]|nr:MAG: hypothetical protein IPP08_11110 [Chlorobiota bacterium]
MKIIFFTLTLFLALLTSKVCFSQHGPTNWGKEFYTSFPSNWENGATKRYCRLYITSNVKTKVEFSIGYSLKKILYTIPFDVISYDFNITDAQVFIRGDFTPIPNDSVYSQKAIHIKSDAPIIVYGMNRASFTSDGMLIIPVNALGKMYIVSSSAGIGASQKLPSQFLIIGAYDSSIVTVTLPTDQVTPNHSGLDPSFKILINKGDVFSAMSFKTLGDLTGTLISSTKPIAVTSGNQCTYLPDSRYPACDHIEEMLTPISTWGNSYYALPIETRLKSDLFRIFASQDSTNIFINGKLYGQLNVNELKENKSWFSYLHDVREPIVFTSNKPIFVEQYNNSAEYDHKDSDPFMMNVLSINQFQKEILFTTPSNEFIKNYVSIVTEFDDLNSLEIKSSATGNWQKIISIHGQKYDTFMIKTNGIKYIGKTFLIQPGIYQIRNSKPFGAYIYGFDAYDSYGYPLHGNYLSNKFKDSINPVSEKGVRNCNGYFTNKVQDFGSGITTIDIDLANSYNFSLSNNSFIIGENSKIEYQLQVDNKYQNAKAVIIISDMAGNFKLDTFEFLATKINFLLDTNNFRIKPLQTKNLKILVQNLSNKIISKNKLILRYGNRGFKLKSPLIEFQLVDSGKIGNSIESVIEFNKAEVGHYTDSLGIEDDCGVNYYLELTATVFQCGSITSSDLNFGKTNGKKLDTAIIKESSSNSDIYLNYISGPFGLKDERVFKITNPIEMPSINKPILIKSGSTNNISVTFNPQDNKKYLDSIILTFGNLCDESLNDSVIYLVGEGDGILSLDDKLNLIDNISLSPNPSYEKSNLKFELLKNGLVNISLFNPKGSLVKELINKQMTTGIHNLIIDSSNLESGNYECIILVNNMKHLIKMIVIK